MRVLALDTATPATAVAFAEVSGEGAIVDAVEARDDPAAGSRPAHARVLLELIEGVLQRAGGWHAVDRLAVGIGPGTFTGLRIGLATAHALARARELELVGISTLAALGDAAYRASPTTGSEPPSRRPNAAPASTPLLAVVDARRGEVFAAAWPAGKRPGLDPPSIGPSVHLPTELAASAAGAELLTGAIAVGDGAVRYASELCSTGIRVPPADDPRHRVTALAHCRIGTMMPSPGSGLPAPVYLRLPDAELAKIR